MKTYKFVFALALALASSAASATRDNCSYSGDLRNHHWSSIVHDDPEHMALWVYLKTRPELQKIKAGHWLNLARYTVTSSSTVDFVIIDNAKSGKETEIKLTGLPLKTINHLMNNDGIDWSRILPARLSLYRTGSSCALALQWDRKNDPEKFDHVVELLGLKKEVAGRSKSTPYPHTEINEISTIQVWGVEITEFGGLNFSLSIDYREDPAIGAGYDREEVEKMLTLIPTTKSGKVTRTESLLLKPDDLPSEIAAIVRSAQNIVGGIYVAAKAESCEGPLKKKNSSNRGSNF